MTIQKITQIGKGFPLLLGTNRIGNGYQFAIEAPEDAEVSLLLYYKKSAEPTQEIPLEGVFSDGQIRSVFLSGFQTKDFEYNYRINGEVVQDPHAYLLHGRETFGETPSSDEHKVRCAFLKGAYDWKEDRSPKVAYEDMILYKLHVRGYTMRRSGVPEKKRGTFAGLIHMIPYWKKLGINAIELMPAYEFAEMQKTEKPNGMVRVKTPKNYLNYWGYQKGCYAAPKSSYCAMDDPEKEFKTLIRTLHKAGMECIMEFYFPSDVKPLTVLRTAQFWRLQYHVDGFHMIGEGVPKNLLVADPILSGVKIMTDGYAYEQVPKTEERYLAEYNDGFLYDMRSFLKGDADTRDRAMWRIRRNMSDQGIIHYMASQNGFTLADMVAYNEKHNEANGEMNQDGLEYNISWNCGEEGVTRKRKVNHLRDRQMRNAVLLLMLSQGTPMLYAGDEFGNSQDGNNNAYCQDNEIGWVDWEKYKKNKKFYEFVQKTIAFRMEHPVFHGIKEPKCTDYKATGIPDLSYHGETAWALIPDHMSLLLGVLFNGAYARKKDQTQDNDFYLAINFHEKEKSIAVPNPQGKKKWYKILDTSVLDRAGDFVTGEEINTKMMEIPARTIIILTAK